MRWFLPQIVFYGIGATIGAILNIRGRFGPPMVTPVLNNLVVIAIAVIFIFLPGPQPPTLAGLTTTQIWVLGAGTTLGVIAMTVALVPYAARERVPLPARGSTCATQACGRRCGSAAGCWSTSPRAS